MQRGMAAALVLALAPAMAFAAPKTPVCVAKPTVTVDIAPFELIEPPNKPERLYPDAARKAMVGGHVTLECNAVSGALANCAIDDETPADQGFGASALKVAKTLDVRTPMTAQIVRVQVQYDILPPTDPSCPATQAAGS